MLEINVSLKTLLTVIFLCITGIIFSVVAIDKQIDSYIADMRAEIIIVNNTDNYIDMEQDGEKTTVTINPKKEVAEENENTEEFYGIVTSTIGLNIRKEASVNSEKIGALYYGAEVKILEDCGDWYRTENGYIFKEFVLRI
jgi:uncharacterized protein YgiM (DUF1202 family)